MPYTQAETDAYLKIRGAIVMIRILLSVIAGVVTVALKAAGYVNYSWTVATAPIWGAFLYALGTTAAVAMFSIILTTGRTASVKDPADPSRN